MAFMTKSVRVKRWVLWMIALLGILIFVIVKLVPGLDLGVWGWVLVGMGLLAAAGAAFGGSGGYGSPHFRKVRFFNTTDTKVKTVKITPNPATPTQPHWPSPNLPVPPLPDIPPGDAVFHDATYDDPFSTDVTGLDVVISVENPAHPGGRTLNTSINVSVPAGQVGFIEELVVVLGGTAGAYSGAAWAMFGVDDAVPLGATPPVPVAIP